MIRGLWTILSVLAIANLLALLAFVGWLVSSERLDLDRFNELRETLSETIPAREARLEEEARDARLEAAEAEEERRALIPPLTAADKLRNNAIAEEVDRQRLERLSREVRDLRRTIDRERSQLDERVELFEAEKADFERMRSRIREIEGEDQFRKAVTNLQAQRPEKARDILQALIDGGEVDQAVAYLNAMGDRQAAKIIGAFEDAALAADLLERLRTRGTETRAP
jgi:hypothetical protein